MRSPHTLELENIYIEGNEYKGIPDITIERDDVQEYVYEHTTPVIAKCVSTSDGLTFTATLAVDKLDFYKFIGLYTWVTDYCPNRRVVHLIKYGKTKRVREKNFRRACRILEKELRL